MRQAVEALKTGPQLHRDVFMRGDPEAVTDRWRRPGSTATSIDLITAYVGQKRRASTAAATARVRSAPIRWRRPATGSGA